MPAVCDWYALFAEYRPPVPEQSTWPDGKFRSCNSCNDGWLVSKTEKGNDAVFRCECWWQYLCEKLAVGRAELTQALKDREVERNKRGQRR